MATLVAGQQYGLSSQANFGSQKTVLFVKLTDSSLKAIEELSRNGGNPNQRLSINFHNSDGVISIPTKNGDPSNFRFTISDLPETDGSFECVKQSSSRSIESLGSIGHKMQIHATADSYEVARNRVAEVEQQSKNYGTKVINTTGSRVGRKVKLKLSSNSIPPRPANFSPPTFQNNAIGNSTSSYPQFNQSHHQKQSLPSNRVATNNYAKTSRPVSEIMKRNYRDRVIQLLALRPYKKPEILARLMKDGVRDKDKKSLTTVLRQVAVLKDNTYDIAKHAWQEVSDDWPFYSESEKQLLKRRRQKLSPLEENPIPEIVQRTPSPLTMKRSATPTTLGDSNPCKKQRISHYQKINPSDVQKRSPASSAPVSNTNIVMQKTENVLPNSSYKLNYDANKQIGSTHKSVNNNCSNSLPSLFKSDNDTNSLSYDSSSNSPFSVNRNSANTYADENQRSLPQSGKSLSVFKHYHSSSKKVNSTGSSPASSPDSMDSLDSGFTRFHKYSDGVDFARKYIDIKNDYQRNKYKEHYNNEHSEYLILYKKISETSDRFTDLGNSLKNAIPNSLEYNKIRSQIIQEYQEGNYKKLHQKAKSRFHYLHEKLTHIKRLIADYDQKRLQL